MHFSGISFGSGKEKRAGDENGISGNLAFVLALCTMSPAAVRAQSVSLPPPNPRPISSATLADPILEIAERSVPASLFRPEIESAVLNHPSLQEARAGEAEAAAARRQTRAGLFPTVDITLNSNRSIARDFSNDPDNVVERSRALGRTDATLTLQQNVLDFGATSSRIVAGNARVRAAKAGTSASADDIALRAISIWYEVYAQRVLEKVASAFVLSQQRLRHAVERRIEQGVSAPGDLARIDSYIASANIRLASYRRGRLGAEAQYAQIMGHPAPVELMRAPDVSPASISSEDFAGLVDAVPAVKMAEAQAAAARHDARAARAEKLPTVSAGIDAGRYGLFENRQDYDVRGRITLRARLSAGITAREDQASARAHAAEARAARIREEALRDATIAFSDTRALEDQFVAVAANYVASRDARDVLAERFRIARGTLFDVLAAEDSYFSAAASYVQTLLERDVAKYALLSRTGRLLPYLGITIEDEHGSGGQP
ncbi:TolC family protein [Sphingomonas panacis]|nr:TolC family protein [Sphingomonas panacis]